MRIINEIIIHCSDSDEKLNFTAKDIDAWHRQKGWSGIGYHFVIDLDGTLELGRPLCVQGAHCEGHNAHSIGICYIGGRRNGEMVDTRTPAQKVTLKALVTALCELSSNTLAVHGHRYYNKNKACPCFNVEQEFKSI